MAGYEGDAHSLVNHTLVPRSQASGRHLIEELILLAKEKSELEPVIENIPSMLINWLQIPEGFTGYAGDKALEVARRADDLIEKYGPKKEA